MSIINPVSYSLSPYGISFPSHGNISKKDILKICDVFKNFLEINDK